jgi:hypothetical protein
MYSYLGSTPVVTLPVLFGAPAVFFYRVAFVANLMTPSSFALKQSCILAQNTLNTGGWLQLYQNNFTPNADTLLSQFIPANFLGYSPINLRGLVPACQKGQTGLWQFVVPPQTFNVAGPPYSTLYGAYVVYGANWICALPFPTPIVPFLGETISVVLQWQDWALNLLVPAS